MPGIDCIFEGSSVTGEELKTVQRFFFRECDTLRGRLLQPMKMDRRVEQRDRGAHLV